MRHTKSVLLALTAIAVLIAQPLTRPAFSQAISPSAMQQIRDLVQEKVSRTAVQRKLGSSLVYSIKAARGERLTPTIASFPNAIDSLDVDVASRVLVDIKCFPNNDLVAGINRAGGVVLYASAPQGSIRARIPLNQLDSIAGRTDVGSIKPSARAILNRRGPSPAPAPVVTTSRGFMVPAAVARLLEAFTFAGSLVTQGDVSHQSNTARAKYGIDGTGVKVGVLSDSAEEISFLIGTGDLPPDVVDYQDIDQTLNGGPGTSEGTAMMEIIHDMAPGAKLFFASAFNGEQSFADNIVALRNVYHCDVIVDDVSYLDEAVFQDSIVAQAVNDVTADGALYFSSVANSGNLTSGTSGTWEGDFLNGGANGSYTLHNFGGGQTFDRLTSSTTAVTLSWSDPLGASNNDYDLFVLNAAGTAVLYASTDPQNGTQDPFEGIFTNSAIPVNSRIVIGLFNGTTRALHLDTWGGRLGTATAGNTHGHNGGANSISVAAVYWNSARTGTRAFVGGAANPTETFSSDGPRRIFYNPNGTPITLGNFLFGTNGGLLLIKPDMAAADGVGCRTPGFFPFFGTSAAAPHAAAVAALIKSAKPGLTNAQIYQAMISTALDIRAAGIDRDSGYGIVMAPQSISKALSK
ncbi:MAG: S8 family serine peptidase [Acidobacteriota bacterium]|jgi:hypothetical protein